MQSLYSESEAPELAAAANSLGVFAADLEARVYTSRLLGRQPELVLHGGGNTSVKTTTQEITGETVEVLCVKGSGWDLATIGQRGFAICRLAALRRMALLPALSDTEMVRGLRSQMLDPSGPTPSVEALLHALLPGKFVDHTHADAALVILDQPDAERLTREVWGERACFIPYTMPGFVLAKAIAERLAELPTTSVVALEKHGIFTWGDSAKESYERMIAAVTQAEVFQHAASTPVTLVSNSSGKAFESPVSAEQRSEQRRLSSVLRGCLSRLGGGRGGIVRWRNHPAISRLCDEPAARDLVRRGPITPDHVIRTKPWPLWLEPAPAATSDELLQKHVEAALTGFAADYQAYFERSQKTRATNVTRLDSLPRAVLVPGLGLATLGSDVAAADIVGDLFEHAAGVMLNASRLGSYAPVSEIDLFDVEYWSLEQAKLGGNKEKPALAGRVALVSGAASGIGRATAELFALQGAHVFLLDRHGPELAQTLSELATKVPSSRLGSCVCDLLDPRAGAAALEAALDCFGGVDIVVSNAGTAPSGLLHDAGGTDKLTLSLEINLLSHQRLVQAAADVLLRQGIGGCLLFNASKSAFNPGPKFGPYAVAKSGLIALMKQYAVDLGAAQVRANAVNADRVRTALFSGGVLEARAAARGVSPDDYFRENLLRRETTAHDVAHAFFWLATAEGTTGCVLTVDGGNAAAFPR